MPACALAVRIAVCMTYAPYSPSLRPDCWPRQILHGIMHHDLMGLGVPFCNFMHSDGDKSLASRSAHLTSDA